MEKVLDMWLLMLGLFMFLFLAIRFITAGIVLIRHCFFKKDYPKKVLIESAILYLPFIILGALIAYFIYIRRQRNQKTIELIDNKGWFE